MTNYKRRNLSGIYVFDTFPGETHRQPTCIEDCPEAKRKRWISTLDRLAQKNLLNNLIDTCTNVWCAANGKDYADNIKAVRSNLHGDVVADCLRICSLITDTADRDGIVAADDKTE